MLFVVGRFDVGPDGAFFSKNNSNMAARFLFLCLAIVCASCLASNVLVLDDTNFWDYVGGVDGVMVEFYARTH